MKVHQIIDEASYVGNLGMMEMFKFYKVASETQKRKMRDLLAKGFKKEAWEFLQQVTGIKLKDLEMLRPVKPVPGLRNQVRQV